ncbi:Hypothetical predicted protein, partial [Pelobates cultripes]
MSYMISGSVCAMLQSQTPAVKKNHDVRPPREEEGARVSAPSSSWSDAHGPWNQPR